MNIILTEKVNNLGNLGDIVHVKPGYARNYLLEIFQNSLKKKITQ